MIAELLKPVEYWKSERAARLRFIITASHAEEQTRRSLAVTANEVERINPQYLGRSC